ncbi:MAG: HD domain-containing protein [Nitrosomonadales bacterium]|nr:HD domain-containing protein [Nitrosomonadales bacterium]
MKNSPMQAEIDELFNNDDPRIVWAKVVDIIRRINPDYDFSLVQSVYDDVLRLFRGAYPDYGAIKTLYHDLSHTLEVLICGVRLMHGVHVSGDRLTDEEVTSILLAILMHDVGYAQRKGEESGTGAQYTQTHVQRGIDFMRRYFSERELAPGIAVALTGMIMGTEHNRPFSRIDFDDDRARMLARIVATADITGQMADRIYLEKLLFLYLEFREANFGSYQSMYDLLCQTNRFYEMTREKLDGALGGIYKKLAFHFIDTMGVDKNFYLESIEKNMAYLSRIVANDEAELFNMLKRNGVAERSRTLGN